MLLFKLEIRFGPSSLSTFYDFSFVFYGHCHGGSCEEENHLPGAPIDKYSGNAIGPKTVSCLFAQSLTADVKIGQI